MAVHVLWRGLVFKNPSYFLFCLTRTDFLIIRSMFFRVDSLKELFDTVEPAKINIFILKRARNIQYNLIKIFDFIFVYTTRWSRSHFMLF